MRRRGKRKQILLFVFRFPVFFFLLPAFAANIASHTLQCTNPFLFPCLLYRSLFTPLPSPQTLSRLPFLFAPVSPPTYKKNAENPKSCIEKIEREGPGTCNALIFSLYLYLCFVCIDCCCSSSLKDCFNKKKNDVHK